MLSDKVIKLAAETLAKYRELDMAVREETEDRWGVCVPPAIQLYARSDYPHSKLELELLVGPVEHTFSADRCAFYDFKLGEELGCAGVPLKQPTQIGGAQHDVIIDQNA